MQLFQDKTADTHDVWLKESEKERTWEESRAAGSRLQRFRESGGPVQLLWANMWRQDTARAMTVSSLHNRNRKENLTVLSTETDQQGCHKTS